MTKFKKIISLAIVAAMTCTLVLTGCGSDKSSKSPVKEGTTTQPETLKEVKLKFYFGNNSQNPFPDNDKVMAEINKILKTKINATIDLTLDLTKEAEKKIPLMLASGEEYDIMAMAEKIFTGELAKGGFMELDQLLAKYMPERMKKIAGGNLSGIKYNDKIYLIPSDYNPYVSTGWIIRGDLRKKYNIPEIKDINGMDKYMEALKKNEPGVIPFNSSASDPMSFDWNFVRAAGNIKVDEAIGLVYNHNSDKVQVMFDWELKEFKDFLAKSKEFADKGYWSKNAYASKAISRNEFLVGTSFVAAGHIVNANDMTIMLKNTHPDWEVEFVRYPQNYDARPEAKGICLIPKTAKNPERALIAMELLRTDRELSDLMIYGIKGEHYNLTADGKVISTPVGSERYAIERLPLAWPNRNFDLIRQVNGSLPLYAEIQKKVNDYTTVSKVGAFWIFNKTPVASEAAAVTEVFNLYRPLLIFGAFENVDTILKEYTTKMKAAGADKVKAEAQKQVDELLKNKK